MGQRDELLQLLSRRGIVPLSSLEYTKSTFVDQGFESHFHVIPA